MPQLIMIKLEQVFYVPTNYHVVAVSCTYLIVFFHESVTPPITELKHGFSIRHICFNINLLLLCTKTIENRLKHDAFHLPATYGFRRLDTSVVSVGNAEQHCSREHSPSSAPALASGAYAYMYVHIYA